MKRGPTKAEQILKASRNRLDTAEQSLSETYIAVERAKAVRDALARAHYDLEASLATTRKKRTPKPSADRGLPIPPGYPALNPPSAETNGASLTPEMIEGEKKKNRAPKATAEQTPGEGLLVN